MGLLLTPSSDAPASFEELDLLFAGFKSEDEVIRRQYVDEIEKHVQILIRELPPDDVQKLWEVDISRRLAKLISGQSSAEKLGGLDVVSRLTSVVENEGLDPKRNLPRLYNCAKTVLPSTEFRVMDEAAVALGKIIRIGGPLFGEAFMDFEVPGSLQFLSTNNADGRYAGILVLNYLARHNSAVFYPHITLVMDKLLPPLKDIDFRVREAAFGLLGNCLHILLRLEKGPVAYNAMSKILQEGRLGLKSQYNAVEVVHGSLLVCKALFEHAGKFMTISYFETSEMIMKFRDHKDALIRQTVINFIAVLAKYDVRKFSDHIFHRAMEHLQRQLAKPTERSAAFVAIGQIAVCVGSEMSIFLNPVMQRIKYELQQRGKKYAMSDEPLFQCLELLVVAVGSKLTNYIRDLLDLLSESQVTKTFVAAMEAITQHIRHLRRDIQILLLDIISVTLSGQIYKPPGAPLRYSRLDIQNTSNLVHQVHERKSSEQICLALDTIRTFDFDGFVLNELVRRCALRYLEDDDAQVRFAAVQTIINLFARDPISLQDDVPSIEIVCGVIHKLLIVAVTDPDPVIRQAVFKSLGERFDRHLSQTENMRSLFLAINDEVFDIRIAAVKVLGRLAHRNPAPIMPSLRKALIQMMAELHLSNSIQTREECSQLLKIVIQNTRRLIKPYAVPMFVPLLDRATGPNTTIAANIMDCIGELSVVAAEDAIAYVPSLMKIIIAQLSEPVSAKRNAALHALGRLCSSTGYVIDPLVDYPELSPTLYRIMKAESSSAVRRDVLRVLGILGALDPYRQQSMQQEISTKQISAASRSPATEPPSSTSSHDQYFQAVVMKALLEVLEDSSLNHIHHIVIESIMTLFRSLGLECVSYLPQVFPALTEGTKTARYKEYYLSSLTALIDIVKEHVRNYVPQICSLVTTLWNTTSAHQHLISVVEALGKALDAEFKPYMGEILPYILRVFDDEATSEKKSNAQMKAFDALLTFGLNLEEYLHLTIPAIVKVFERGGTIALRKRAVQTIEGLTRRVNLADHASRIIHPLTRTLSATMNAELRQVVIDLLCALVVQAQDDFVVFVPSISKVLKRCNISNARYEGLVRKLLNGEHVAEDNAVVDLWCSDIISTPTASIPPKLTINPKQLKESWNLSNVLSEEDWDRWFSQFSQELIRQSPSHVLRACTTVVSEHPPFALALFNAAFLSCWSELELYGSYYKDDFATSIQSALSSPSTSKELSFRLLNLCEFMSRCGDLVLGDRAIGQYAMTLKAYAKALHYKELGYFSETSPSMSLIEELVEINTRLQQHDAAFGLITVANERGGTSQHLEWYERLHKWKFALAEYEKRMRENPHQPGIILGMIRCLHALGEWDRLAECVEGHWENATVEEQQEMAGMGAAAAWSLSEWDSMAEYTAVMPDDAPFGSFYKAILAVHNDDFGQATRDIGRARDLLAQEFTTGVEESRTRTYDVMIRAQLLSELEEIMQYKEYADQPERQESMKRTWMKRLHGCQREVESWQRILQVRSMVLSPGEDTAVWIKFANICRKSDRMMLAEKAIDSLIDLTNDRDKFEIPSSVIYAQHKFMWAKAGIPEEKEMVLAHFRTFTSDLERDFLSESNASVNDKRDETQRLLARCHFKQGEWQRTLLDNWSLEGASGVLHSLKLATKYDKSWYKAWHTWALMNFEVAEHLASATIYEEKRFLPLHVNHAIKGFYWSISLHKESALQDVLRILTLWFKHGSIDEISHVVADGFSHVDIDTWLDVIPQIIARIQTPNHRIRQNIKSLLNEVGRHHPQALVYPLSVASKSSSESRKKVAVDLMNEMKSHSISIVEQALLVGQELIRVAMLWYDQWFEGLEEASRIYKIANDPAGMIAHLDRLHDMVEREPVHPDRRTPQEEMFVQAFGQYLREARKYGNKFRTHRNIRDMEQAYKIYVAVYERLALQRNNATSLDLQYVSPMLAKAKNLELAVPGSYSSRKDIVYIVNFTNKLSVFTSKQRPRKMSIRGSDGVDYQFLLKGHEDLRQDERAMQLFSLVNTLLSADVPSHKRRLQIRHYPVVPIGPNVGLVGIVEESDTLNELIRAYRRAKDLRYELEYNVMLRMEPKYETQPLKRKVEVFEYAMEICTGKDIDRSLWDNSASSEHWLERRNTYTQSLAVGSMVGHILGLGDRHPGNIMLERTTGKVVHIDFGDCFEVAMLRKEFPEKVPFRLTRMLRRAMEVSGVEGTFRNTCEISMRVLRENRESLMAVLEAFVYDPLINWRLEVDNYRVEDTNIQPEQFVRDAAGDPQGPNRRMRTDENDIFNADLGTPWETEQEVRNERALAAINRVKLKLSGRDFEPEEELTVEQQVRKLIQQATSIENLCQHFPGWCAYW